MGFPSSIHSVATFAMFESFEKIDVIYANAARTIHVFTVALSQLLMCLGGGGSIG